MSNNNRYNGQQKIMATDDQKAYLINNCSTMSIEELAHALNVSCHKIRFWIKDLGIKRDKIQPSDKKKYVPFQNAKLFEHDKTILTI